MSDTVGDLRGGKSGTDVHYRRFADKLMYGSCALVLILVATVWAITWRSTDAKVVETKAQAEKSVERLDRHNERIIKLEVLQDHTQRDLKSIDEKQSKLEGKLDAMQNSVNQVLLELKKSK